MHKMSKKTNADMFVKIWEHCKTIGWAELGMDCLYTTLRNGERVRFNFRDNKILKLEVKRELNDNEKKLTPHKTSKWEILETGEYKTVKIEEGGELFFAQKKEIKKKPVVKRETRKETD